ncbi:hypothetical protein [Bacillus mobilis]|uniref:hypothetical protein n=1 Tax=Bacillus mobilis TaxID=2026190 RepID=UPI002E1FB518|nr:hypothetical protein [Bacillus mobilis]MED0955003.1 hypothetical protein [Bacillus mobilis]
MKRKISTAVVGLSVFSFGLFGVNIGDGGVVKAAHGDTPAPKLENHGDYGGAPAYDHGRPPISSYNKGDTWAPAFNIGDTGGAPKLEGHEHFPAPKLDSHGDSWAPAYNKGDGGGSPAYTNTHGEGMSPKQESHADFFAPTLEAHGNTGAPALNVGDTPTPKLEGHGDTPAPKLESYADTWAPKQETHADLSSKLDSRGDTGGAPANSEHGTGW